MNFEKALKKSSDHVKDISLTYELFPSHLSRLFQQSVSLIR